MNQTEQTNPKTNKIKELDVVNPFDLHVIGTVPVRDWAEVDALLEQASTLHRNKSQWLPAYQRIDILKKAAAIMSEEKDTLAFQIANEGGKPLNDAIVEVDRAIDSVEHCIKSMGHLTGKQIPMDLTQAGSGRLAFTSIEPIGPVVAVSAFNHPLNLIVHQIGPAIATGCPALIKPANDTPLSCQRFVEILHEAGLPAQWCQMVACDRTVAEKMVTDPRVAFFSFIGSANVGWSLRSKLAPGTRCALEHGGVAPVIIDRDIDVKVIMPSLIKGGFYHSGQVCVSVQRVYVPRGEAEHFADIMAEQASKLVVGNAIYAETQCGPLIRPKEVTRVSQWVDEARGLGAKIVTGGRALSETTYAPTVIYNPPKDAKVSTMEIFGPVVCVYPYDEIDEAIAQANALSVSFQAAVFTDNLNTATYCIQNIDASAVMVNDHTAFRVDWMPFAGLRDSGYGVGGIGYTMHDMVVEKMAVIKLGN